ncbi:lipoprotein releasing system transmembrane protein [Blattabacterium sp. (Blattella germanica) str. Bge]|uniref:ABC transporter permease n=1 Tax=Blattabacterium sp. (Blattella germanica) TaxID=624186 RepID=UPI0001BB62C2|nr:FtsX-like permease family protein [Blattabacterium sp. (Blattella germanica)]ACY40066.1 lipoprotein releasing system transmembrane protein [Blattabacterium sp. (Blattella germanica) str. Bge]
MKTEFYIAIRYFFSKKKTNIVNIIVFLSVLSLNISTFSLSIILFVFSGLENLNKKFYQIHYPDILISSSNEGDLFIYDENINNKIKSIKEIVAFSKTMEKKIFLHYNNQEYFLSLKGVDTEYEKVMNQFKKIDLTNISYPDYLNVYVGLSFIRFYNPMIFRNQISVPDQILFFSYKYKKDKNTLIPFFMKKKISIKGVFQFSQKMDMAYLFCNLYEIQNIIKKKGIQTLEIKIHKKANIHKVKKILMKKFGSKFNIITRIEKEKAFYKVINTEKIFVYFLFSLITFITGFNLFSAIFILQLDKIKELFTLWCIGFSLCRIKTIFLYIGLLITVFGCFSGLCLSYLMSFIQEKYHIVKVIRKIPFPIKITIIDSCIVTSIIFGIGIVLSFFSSKRINSLISGYYYK